MIKRKKVDIEKQIKNSLEILNKGLRGSGIPPIKQTDLKSIAGFLGTIKNGFDLEKEQSINTFFDFKKGNIFLFLSYELGCYIKIKRDCIVNGLIKYLYDEKTDLGIYKITKRKKDEKN